MHDRLWLFLATLAYLASASWGIYALGSQRPVANRWTFLSILTGFAFHTLFLRQRGQEIGHCPITNLFETLAFFSWSLVLTYLVVGPAYRDQTAVKGQRYAYRVTAIDIVGNESAPSADVQETLREQ